MSKVKTALRHAAWFCIYGTAGALLVLVAVFVLFLNSRPELEPWHQARLDEEYTVRSPVASFANYLALEDRLFAQLEREVYARKRRGW